jgi:hypothetical protein
VTEHCCAKSILEFRRLSGVIFLRLLAYEDIADSEYAPKIKPSASSGAFYYVLKGHWPEYLMEAFGLGLFMISACGFAILREHPASPVHQAIPDATLRRV